MNDFDTIDDQTRAEEIERQELTQVDMEGGIPSPAPAAADEQDQGEGEGEPARIRFAYEEEDPVERLAAKRDAERLKTAKTFEGDFSDPEVRAGRWARDGEEEGEPQAEQDAAVRDEAPKPDEPLVKLKIRGRDVEMPMSEVVARAQKVEAADDYLSEARRAADEAKELRRALQTGEISRDEVEAEPDRHRPEPPQGEAAAEYKRLIDAIQFGSEEEATTALADYEQRTAERALQIIEQRGRREAVRADMMEGTNYVQETYPEIAGDEIRADAAANHVARLARETIARFFETKIDDDQRAALAAKGVTPDSIRMLDRDASLRYYADLRAAGIALPPAREVFRLAADQVATTFGITPAQGRSQPSPAPQTRGNTPANGIQGRSTVSLSPQRNERKAGLVNPPQRAGASPSAPPSAPQTADDARRAAVREMREEPRGFPLRGRA